MEEGNADNRLTPASIALSDQIRNADARTVKKQQKALSHGLPSGSEDSTKSPPNMKKTSKIAINGKKRKRNGCLPLWVSDAPRWLKLVIAFSTALLVGAVVLVTVALSAALANKDASGSSSSLSGSGSTATSAPTYAGVATSPEDSQTEIPSDNMWEGTPRPTEALPTKRPGGSSSTPAPVPTDTDGPDVDQPTSASDPGGNDASTTPPGSTSSFDPQVTTFFVTGGRFTNDALERVPEQLATMPVRGGTSFLVHLGDWNSPYATRCDRQSYQDVNDLFSNSTIPVYFVPGDNDFNGKFLISTAL
jgi:hypothetical protein